MSSSSATVGPWNRRWPEVADALRGRIKDGTLPPGSLVLAKSLPAEFGIGENTAGRVLRALQAEGLVRLRRAVGYVVLAREPAG